MYKAKRSIYKVLIPILSVLSVVFGLLLGVTPLVVAKANTEFYPFDTISVFDDLTTSTVDNKPFNLAEFPYNDSGSVGLITMVEWCYSYDTARQDDYALYLYIYNPQDLNIDTDSNQNKVQLSVRQAWSDEENDQVAVDYEKYQLAYCNKSTHPSYKNLFYKFRIIDHNTDSNQIVKQVNSNGRRYDISGIELLIKDQATATEFSIGGSYTFSGYTKGYGREISVDDLSYTVTELETIRLDVRNTFFRTESSSKGKGYQNQLDSVYFSVPNALLNKYGKLQRIKAEWYEYKTSDILVTSHNDFYNKAKNLVGTELLNANYNLGYYLATNYSYNLLHSDYTADWAWNFPSSWQYRADDYANTLYYILQSVGNIQNYSPYGDYIQQENITSNALYNYILNYNKTFNNGTLPIKNNTISADLFQNNVDNGHTKGHNVRDFDADVDLHNLISYTDTSPSFWDKWTNYGFWSAVFGGIPTDNGYSNLSPIYKISSTDFKSNNNDTANNILVRADDINALKEYQKQATENNSTTFLFRYSTTDYFAEWTSIYETGETWGFADKEYKTQAYRAIQTVFFDFDIIQLTFSKDGRLRVIPVVSSPQDIINGVTPPTYTDNIIEEVFDKFLSTVKDYFLNTIDSLLDLFTNIPLWVWIIIAIIVIAIVVTIVKPFFNFFVFMFKVVGYTFYFIFLIITLPIRGLIKLITGGGTK